MNNNRYNKKIIIIIGIVVLAVAILAVGMGAVVVAQDDGNSPIAKVADRTITENELELAVERLGPQYGDISDEEKRKLVFKSMVDFTVLAKLAEKQGLDKDPETIKTLEYLKLQALHNAYFKKAIEPQVTQEVLKEAYETQIAEQEPEPEVKASHILLEEEQQAIDVITELDGGADFAELAKEKSTGPSAPQGGDLGFFSKGRMVPEFEQAAFAMEIGTHSKEPVKTQFGYHVIKVIEKRDKPLPTFEELEQRLRQAALARIYAQTVQAQRAAIDIEIIDDTLKN